jgi:hypothetical protein
VVGKRLKEINSEGLVRLGGFPLDRYAPDKDNRSFDFDLEFKIYDFLKEIKTDINYRSEYRNNPEWLGNGYMIKDTAKLSDYVSTQVELMTYLTKTKGYDHIKYWTIQNELSTRDDHGAWGKWDSDAPAPGYPFMPNYEWHIREMSEAFDSNDLGFLKLLGPDTYGPQHSRIEKYVLPKMDDVIDIYGAHCYKGGNYGSGLKVYELNWNNPDIYQKLLAYNKKIMNGVGQKDKEFIWAEFDNFTADDIPATPKPLKVRGGNETPELGIYQSEFILAALNSGMSGAIKWMLYDAEYSMKYNKTGSFADSIEEWRTRPHYYGLSLLTRYFRKNSSVFEVNSSDPLVYTAAIQNNIDKTYAIAVINRNLTSRSLTINLEGSSYSGDVRVFEFNTADDFPLTVNGDLQRFKEQLSVDNGIFSTTIPPYAMLVITNEFDETLPAAVQNVFPLSSTGPATTTWSANSEPDLVYYKIYRGETADFEPSKEKQIGSTIALSFRDNSFNDGQEYYYQVNAVDKYGNESGIIYNGYNDTTTIAESKAIAPELRVFPNPVKIDDSFFIKGTAFIDERMVEMKISDCSGKLIFKKLISTYILEEDGIEISSTNLLKPGIYIISLTGSDHTINYKIQVI